MGSCSPVSSLAPRIEAGVVTMRRGEDEEGKDRKGEKGEKKRERSLALFLLQRQKYRRLISMTIFATE